MPEANTTSEAESTRERCINVVCEDFFSFRFGKL